MGSASIMDHFDDLEDPRIERSKRHQLLNIIAVCAVYRATGGHENTPELVPLFNSVQLYCLPWHLTCYWGSCLGVY